MNKNNIRCKIPCFYIALTRQNNVSVMLMILNAYFYVKIVTLLCIYHLDFPRSWSTKTQLWRLNFRLLRTHGSEKLWALSGQLPAAIRTPLNQILPGAQQITPIPAGSPEGSPGPSEKGERPKYENEEHRPTREEKYFMRALLKWVSQIMRRLFSDLRASCIVTMLRQSLKN